MSIIEKQTYTAAQLLEMEDRKQFEAYLAERHHLTVNEAREELEDFLFTEALNREATQALSK